MTGARRKSVVHITNLKKKFKGNVTYRLIQQENGYWCSVAFKNGIKQPDLEIHPQYAKSNAIRCFNHRIERYNAIAESGNTLPFFDEQADFCEVIAFQKLELPAKPVQMEKHKEKKMNKPSFIDDAKKEAQLLKIAKERYERYADVQTFAQELALPAGKVYLTLKAHSFIRQNETAEYRVLDAYYKNNGDLKAITTETGLTAWVCAQTLKALDLSPNYASYKNRTESNAQGDWAEEEFRRLVPQALDMNMQYQMNNPRFDFIVNGKTVDVKSSVLSNKSRSKQYTVHFKNREGDPVPDFYCVFCVKDREKPHNENGNYHILLIPKEIVPENKMRAYFVPKGKNATSAVYWGFEVQPTELEITLEAITAS